MAFKRSKFSKAAFIARRDYRKVLAPFLPRKLGTLDRKKHKFSAYLSIFNDWDLLLPALKSVARHVDELVVVDGAYDWMVPYLDIIGSDPTRSSDKVYEALEASGIRYRSINRTWKNEVEKRMAGYEACAHRFICRVDADEIFFIDDAALDGFIGSGCAVAEMKMPTYAAPGWLIRSTGLRGLLRRIPSQLFLFDSEKISAGEHLKYLWLVLEADALPETSPKVYPVYESPVAFCAHLTNWRTAQTAVNRGSFYWMNWMRKNGVPWIADLRGSPISHFRDVFERLPASQFRAALSRGSFVIGTHVLRDSEALERSPLSDAQECSFGYLHDIFLRKLADQNLEASLTSQTLINGESVYFDISTDAARKALNLNGQVAMTTSQPLLSIRVRLHTLSMSRPFSATRDLAVSQVGCRMTFEMPQAPTEGSGVLRQSIELTADSGNGAGFCEFILDRSELNQLVA